jgi:hypothetical protein
MKKTVEEQLPWWESMCTCWGKKKDGTRCKLPAQKAYEIAPGNLFIPKMCWRHADQEEPGNHDSS